MTAFRLIVAHDRGDPDCATETDPERFHVPNIVGRSTEQRHAAEPTDFDKVLAEVVDEDLRTPDLTVHTLAKLCDGYVDPVSIAGVTPSIDLPAPTLWAILLAGPYEQLADAAVHLRHQIAGHNADIALDTARQRYGDNRNLLVRAHVAADVERYRP